jgi:hypothetical protein
VFVQQLPEVLGQIRHLGELGDPGTVEPGHELAAPECRLTKGLHVFYYVILGQVSQVGFVCHHHFSTFDPFLPLSHCYVFRVVAGNAVVWLFEIFVPPCDIVTAVHEQPLIVGEVFVDAHFEVVAAIACGGANRGHPKFYVAPNTCSFPNPSSSVVLVGAVLAGNPIDFPSNDAPYSNSSSLRGYVYKKREPRDSKSNLN